MPHNGKHGGPTGSLDAEGENRADNPFSPRVFSRDVVDMSIVFPAGMSLILSQCKWLLSSLVQLYAEIFLYLRVKLS